MILTAAPSLPAEVARALSAAVDALRLRAAGGGGGGGGAPDVTERRLPFFPEGGAEVPLCTI